jgi:hypothetical protein
VSRLADYPFRTQGSHAAGASGGTRANMHAGVAPAFIRDALIAKARAQDLALKGYERAAPASHESQLAYGSPVFAAGGIPVSHRCQSLPDNPCATGEADAADAL